MLQAGWPTELTFELILHAINGYENADARPHTRRAASAEFEEITDIWARLRRERVIGVRTGEGQNREMVILFFRQGRVTDAQQTDFDRFREILGLEPEATEFRIVPGLIPAEPNQIAVLTASIFDLLGDLAWRFEVPPEHVNEGRTLAAFKDHSENLTPLIQIKYSKEPPEGAFTAIRNRDYWFYIDDGDMTSKRAFGFLQVVLSLAETGEGGRGPLVSIGQ